MATDGTSAGGRRRPGARAGGRAPAAGPEEELDGPAAGGGEADEPGAAEAGAKSGTGAGADEPYRPRSALSILGDLRGRGQAGRGTRRGRQPLTLTREEINGLSSQERSLGLGAVLFGAVLAPTLYVTLWRHSNNLTTRHGAGTFLVTCLLFTALLGVGVAVRRRALLGSAAFIAGLAFYTFGGITGLPFLVFGGWLLVRVWRISKERRQEDGSATPAPGRARSRTAAKSAPAVRTPPASKRYTPPRRAGAGAPRRR